MKQMRKRLTYANVMSSLAVFLVLGGATAFAASQLAKDSVGTRQLKSNAVTTAKIRKEAITAAKLRAGAVGSAQLADGSVVGSKLAGDSVTTGAIASGAVTGSDIDAGSMPFARVVDRIRGATPMSLAGSLEPFPLANPTFVQPASQDFLYLGGADFTFASTCAPPRSAVAYVSLDSATPQVLTMKGFFGGAGVTDEGTGTVTRRAELKNINPVGTFAPEADQPHTFSVLAEGECSSGSGITLTFVGVDAIGIG